jgi:hypothetical protein
MAFGAVVTAGTILLAVTIVYLLVSVEPTADRGEFGYHALDAETAAAAMNARGIRVPDGFTFAEMSVYRVFVGADAYQGHYLASGDFAAAKHALAEANPDFPPYRTATCDDEIVRNDFNNVAGFDCAEAELAVTTRTVDGVDVLADNYSGTPPDTETILLAGSGGRVDLYVVSRGH